MHTMLLSMDWGVELLLMNGHWTLKKPDNLIFLLVSILNLTKFYVKKSWDLFQYL